MNKEELHLKYGDVKVFVIENDSLGTEFENGFKIISEEAESSVEGQFNELGFFVPRYEAELDDTIRQIIPYCLIKYEDWYFVTRRIDGDSRLIGKHSIGIGGHVEPPKYNMDNPILVSMFRELDEELWMGTSDPNIEQENVVRLFYLAGIIKSNKTPVDCVHIGLVYVVEVNTWDISVKETDTLEGLWVHKDEIKTFTDNYETWSQICIDNIINTND